MKFKLGDKVRVKDSSKVLHSQYRGRVGKITGVALVDVDVYGYEVDFASGYYFFDDSLEHYDAKRDTDMEYKIGDRVIAVDNIGLYPNGSRGIITAIYRNPPQNDKFDYRVKYDDDKCSNLWSKIVSLESDSISAATSETPVVAPLVHGKESVLESKMEYPSIVITCKGRKTKAVLKRGNEVLRRATASCHLEDDFDQYVGASIALGRLFDRPVDMDAYERTEHSDMSKPFEGKAVCVEKNKSCPISTRFTIGKVYEFSNEYVVADNGGRYVAASTMDENWFVLGAKFIPFTDVSPTATRYEGTIVCVDSDSKMFTPGKAYKVNDGCVYNDDGVLTIKVDSDNIDDLNDEFDVIGARFVEMVQS